MEEELISKKELLELTGISYGQLYRWKRKNLVPEEWFIRKSAFTGQETFFPKQKMLDRMDKILNMKEDLSLDELANMFSTVPTDLSISKTDLVERNIVSLIAIEYAEPYMGRSDVYRFEQILSLFLLDRYLQSGELNLDEGKILLQTFGEHYTKFEGKNCDLMFIRKMGVSACFLAAAGSDIYFENGVKIILRDNIAKRIEELKLTIGMM
ncbi:YhbD family protein [Paenibacillus sp. FSL H8-0034]|uniref:YhbD family protein n=1 Tax=Paenibacillus sp. FSL H8-0034 TaxID=2954671 RepID=UPI0030FA9EBD